MRGLSGEACLTCARQGSIPERVLPIGESVKLCDFTVKLVARALYQSPIGHPLGPCPLL
jgi:hypothetical protein